VSECDCVCEVEMHCKALKVTGPRSLVLVIRRERNAGMYLCLSVACYTTHSSGVFRQTVS